MVFPNFIRQQNICYKMLKLEQEGERLHHVLKMIEKKYLNVKNKPLRYFYLIKDYENMLKCDMSIFDVPNKVGYIYYMICSHKNNIHIYFFTGCRKKISHLNCKFFLKMLKMIPPWTV